MNSSPHQTLAQRQAWVRTITDKLTTEYNDIVKSLEMNPGKFAKMTQPQQESFSFNYDKNISRKRELEILISSPLFRRLYLKFDDKPEPEIVCIGKFSSLDDGIYSWYAPVAVLRDAVPGPFSYARPNGELRTGILYEREDIHIVNGIITNLSQIFSATNKIVIYDSFIASKQSDSFALPEIIEQLEAVQNEIIEYNPRQSIMVTGPAGSGKTTLALHKLAYTLLNPDSAQLYRPEKCMVLVADESAVDYFRSLLITLGIPGVRVVSVFSFVKKLLDLDESSDINTDIFQPKTLQQEIAKAEKFDTVSKSTKLAIQDIYTRGDTELLLLSSIKKHSQLMEAYTVVVRKNGYGEYKKKLQQCEIDLLVIDEFQNYYSEILQSLMNAARAVILSGATNQKLFPHSLSHTDLTEIKQFTLPASYRNKQEIITFLQQCGFAITDSRVVGGTVHSISNDQIPNTVTDYAEQGTVAVIGTTLPTPENNSVQYHNPITVQGLQFTTSIILIDEFIDLLSEFQHNDIAQKIILDALYVSLTRSTDNLILVSEFSRDEIIKKLQQYI